MIAEGTLASLSTEQKLEILNQLNKNFIKIVNKATGSTQK
jgi:hypothetical protein